MKKAYFLFIIFDSYFCLIYSFIGFILKNGHKEYIPPAGVITYEYWNELVKNPELVDEVLASNVANISSVSCIIFVLEILYALAVYDSLRSRDGRWILL